MKKGIDVSHHNAEIDWTQVCKSDIDFAFAKSTEGATFQDSKFLKNFQGMKENEIDSGAFHVFRMTSTPEDQAENIKKTLSGANFDYKTDKLAVSASTGICSGGQKAKCDDPTKHTNDERAENLQSLFTILKQEGFEPIIYTSPSIWDKYYTQEKYNFSNYHLWDAYWTNDKEPKIPNDWKLAGKSYEYWNYSNNGNVDGVSGNISLDKTNPSLPSETHDFI
ncbi:glycoside hydrolase family 25 protein [Wolbachia endosymbiont of Chironomus riparius]|uniref:glycoside hydrolase family 25 protein n=1 Tax=Wolbachia endosymbiont of Chironomus riparius TaxID=2883238 RepID=UPI00209D7A42|nr:glycoside hydrolase family 25 protein [Wolbachia endosymbiont of Chironomus riparius]